MTPHRPEDLIETLAEDARPVRPLASPGARAATVLGALAIGCGLVLAWLSEPRQLLDRYAGRETIMAVEMAAMLATAILAIAGAFFLSIPGGSRKWLLAPIAPMLAWLGLSGAGCWTALQRGESAMAAGHGTDCLLFILGASILLGIPLLWRLARARPIDPLPVACLGGLGVAALAAFMLQFFHPFDVTFLDLGMHVTAVLIVVAATALMRRMALRPV